MELHNAVIEATRRCNMKCAHCLRGEPQNKSMPREHLLNFLRQISYISDVTFTGGEPTLPSGLKVINEFIRICIHLDIEINSFYIVTNAKKWRPEIGDTLAKLWEFCSGNDASAIDISRDQYHDPIELKRQAFRSKLKNYLWQFHGLEIPIHQRASHLLFKHIRTEGRGIELGAYRKNDNPEILIDDEDEDLFRVVEGTLYLNCDGNIINGCDWSYKSQNNPSHIICRADEDLEEAIKKIAVAMNFE